jgi:fumarylacetoacetate (FAA) hydrolase family protein
MTLDIRDRLTSARCLPGDAARALLIGRVWVPALNGPALVRVGRMPVAAIVATPRVLPCVGTA